MGGAGGIWGRGAIDGEWTVRTVSNLVFYAPSTITFISGRCHDRVCTVCTKASERSGLVNDTNKERTENSPFQWGTAGKDSVKFRQILLFQLNENAFTVDEITGHCTVGRVEVVERGG